MKKALIIVSLLFSFSVFAQSSGNFIKGIDTRDLDLIKTELDKADKSTAKVMEQQLLDESKRCVAEDDLDFASDLAEIVLMHNFDNAEAQKLFTSIDKAKKAKAETLARQAEEERLRKEAEEQKRAMEEYQAQKLAEAQAKDDYLERVSSVSFSNFPMRFALIPVSLDVSKSPFADELADTNNLNLKYGLGGNIMIGFKHPYFLAAMEAYYKQYIVPISGKGTKNDIYGRLSFGIPYFSEWVRLCVSYGVYNIKNDNNSVLYSAIKSPRIGFALADMKPVEKLSVNLYADLDLISFYNHSEIEFAYDAMLNLRYALPGSIGSAGKLYIESSTKYYGIRLDKKTETAIDTSLSVGVSLND